MFGFLSGFDPCCQRAAAAYRAYFCGLGAALHRHHGAWARWLVNRDSTFLVLLGAALAKEPPEMCHVTCCNPLGAPRAMLAGGPVLSYAAEVTVCGLSAKLDDDREDERGWRRVAARLGSRLIDAAVGDAAGHLHSLGFPVAQVRAAMAGQSRIERYEPSVERCAAPTASAFGAITAHLAHVARATEAEHALRRLGESLGFLVYAHDAWHDWARDRAQGQFNPLQGHFHLAERRAAVLPAMRAALASLSEALRALPLRRNADLLDAVLIEGAGRRLAEVSGENSGDARRRKEARKERNEIERERGRCCDRWDCCDCGGNCCDLADCCRCFRRKHAGGRSGSACDCNPCDGDGCECCGCDCSP